MRNAKGWLNSILLNAINIIIPKKEMIVEIRATNFIFLKLNCESESICRIRTGIKKEPWILVRLATEIAIPDQSHLLFSKSKKTREEARRKKDSV